jgi:hypothetical protein
VAPAIRTSRLLLSVAVLSGLVTSCDDPKGTRYTIGTIYNGPDTSDRGYPYIGLLSADKGELDIHLDQLPLYAGPANEAFIVDRVHPNPDGLPVLSFPGPRPLTLSAHLSEAQIRQMLNGDYALVVRTSSIEAGQVVGQAKPRSPVGAETQKESGYFVEWSRPGKDGNSRQSGAYLDDDDLEPDARLSLNPPSDNLCWSVDYRYSRAKREVVAARISVLDGKTAPVTFRFEPNMFSAHACLQASKALVAALAAGHVQITITTAAVPAGEFVGPFLLKRVPKASVANPVGFLP